MSLYVIGGGGHAKVVIATLQANGREVKGIFDDAPALQGKDLVGVPILGTVAAAKDMDGEFIIAIGVNSVRYRVAEAFVSEMRWASVIHPRAWVHASARLGPGAVVCAGAIIQPDAEVGAHAVVNTGATVDHDCRIGDYTHLAPGVHLAGGVGIGEGTFLGVGAAALPGVRVGTWSTVGAGAVLTGDLPANVVAVGVPARPIKERPAGWHETHLPIR